MNVHACVDVCAHGYVCVHVYVSVRPEAHVSAYAYVCAYVHITHVRACTHLPGLQHLCFILCSAVPAAILSWIPGLQHTTRQGTPNTTFPTSAAQQPCALRLQQHCPNLPPNLGPQIDPESIQRVQQVVIFFVTFKWGFGATWA